MCQRILKIMAGGSKKFWKRSGKPSVCSEKILFGKEFFLGSFRWTSLKSLTNSQAATCHHLFVALGSTHHFPVGASIRTHRAARSQGKTNMGGQPVVVQPKEGLEPKSSLGTLLARFHSREN